MKINGFTTSIIYSQKNYANTFLKNTNLSKYSTSQWPTFMYEDHSHSYPQTLGLAGPKLNDCSLVMLKKGGWNIYKYLYLPLSSGLGKDKEDTFSFDIVSMTIWSLISGVRKCAEFGLILREVMLTKS